MGWDGMMTDLVEIVALVQVGRLEQIRGSHTVLRARRQKRAHVLHLPA